jgi:hypothetical protein
MSKNKTPHPLDDINWNLLRITTYRGCLISKIGYDRYSMWGKTFDTPEEVDEAINKAGLTISNSITIENNNGSISVTNTEEKY